ncbi:MAG: sensor histidine kinase [Rubrivivax sp.]|nr:sensor histidine kinase [Rubrivivax sp.]
MSTVRSPAWRRSLRWRLLAATVVALLVALVLAGVLLAGLFRDHVQRQAVLTLTAQLDQVTARLEFDADGRPEIDATTLSDPRWSRPRSGLYWQIDEEGAAGGAGPGPVPRRGVLRSRSLWDATLGLPVDALADGAVDVHEVAGPQGEPLLVVERSVRREAGSAPRWRLIVAAEQGETRAAMQRFNGVLAASLAALLALLGAATWAQLAVGLAPLRTLQRAVAAVHDGRALRLEGVLPAEVQPLVDDFNAVLARNAEVVARARTQAGNLAHALKTPLAAMRQAATAAARDRAAAADLPGLVREQVDRGQRHVEWHLARSRAAAAQGLPGARVAVAPLLAGLVRVMEKVPAGRGLVLVVLPADAACRFAGEAEDLQEIVGNVLDNACKWARREVRVAVWTGIADEAPHEAGGDTAQDAAHDAAHDTESETAGETDPEAAHGGPRLVIRIDDDGPGIAAEDRAAVLTRGTRLDESTPGTGLGLSIAAELVALYGGALDLHDAPQAGLRVLIRLPAAAAKIEG